MTTATTLSIGGLGLALAILIANLRPWWKGSRDPKQLLPFGHGFAVGALATICSGGLLGLLASCSAGAANTAGRRAVPGTTGTSDGSIAHASLGQLTPGGGLMVFLLAVGLVLAWKSTEKKEKKRMAGGAFCGTTLCLTAGVAGLLGWLPTTVNTSGDWLLGVIGGAVHL